MDFARLPFKRSGNLIVRGDEPVDRFAHLLRRGKAGSAKRLTREYAKPAFHLVQPRRVRRRKVKMHVGMALEPAVAFGFVRIEIVKNDVDLSIRVFGDNVIHKMQELPTTATGIVSGLDLSCDDVQGGEERRRAVSLVAVRDASECRAIREPKPALSAFQGLN